MEELTRTKVLEVKGLSTKQHLGPAMLHLLKKFTGLTKFKIDLLPVNTWVSHSNRFSHYLILVLIAK